MAEINIRKAEKTDVENIYKLMQQQAAEQNTVLPPHLTFEAMTEGGWGSTAVIIAFVAERDGVKEGTLEGYILGHRAYSTWEGRAMYIKEIYVVPRSRCSGVALQLCRKLLQDTLNTGCTRCDVKIDKKNKSGVAFFEKLGAQNITEAEDWHFFSMDNKMMLEMKAKYECLGQTQIRPATPDDMASVIAMIQELADYEKMSDGPKINAQTMAADSSPHDAFFECFVAESEGTLVGYALCYHTFSSQGRGIYMEDLYVRPTHRCQGLGTILMGQIAQRGHSSGAMSLEFSVLSWNTPSIAFYQQRGAVDLTASSSVQVYRFIESVMKKLVQ